MKKISDIISMPIISLYEGEYIGIVYNVMFDYRLKKCNYAIILDEKENINYAIKFKDIYKIGNQCIYIKNKTCLNLESNCLKELEENLSPINLKVYSLNCELLGTSNDIVINEKYEINELIMNNGTSISSDNIFNIGKNVIIVGKVKFTPNLFKPKQKIVKLPQNENKVMILSDFIKSETKSNISTSKIITDFRFLIGRVLSQDVKALNGEMIAKKNSIITKDIVNKASSYGKLVEIARYSNKN